MPESLTPRDQWVVIRYSASGYDRDRAEFVAVLPSEAEAEREAARLDAESGAEGPRHGIQIMPHVRVQISGEES